MNDIPTSLTEAWFLFIDDPVSYELFRKPKS